LTPANVFGIDPVGIGPTAAQISGDPAARPHQVATGPGSTDAAMRRDVRQLADHDR
jgi:hypothetical protein